MKKFALIFVLGASTLAMGATWNNVVLIDQSCSVKAKDNPDAHTRSCAIQCAKSGYGVLTSDGTYLKFDKAGDDQAASLLTSTDKKDHLRVNVEGEQKGNTIAVRFVKF